MINFDELKKPLTDNDVEWRVGMGGVNTKGPWAKLLCYLTARVVMERLDKAVGPENWSDGYEFIPGKGTVCKLSIKVNATDWVTKTDGGNESNQDAFKGSISDALKRAAVKWGIGRELYSLKEIRAEFDNKASLDTFKVKIKDKYYHVKTPKLDDVRPPSNFCVKCGSELATRFDDNKKRFKICRSKKRQDDGSDDGHTFRWA